MQRPFDPGAFEQAVIMFRFEEAERLVDLADPERQEALRDRIEQRRQTAMEAAQERYRQIVDLGTAAEQEAVASLGKDPTTAPLLACLPESTRRHAQAYLGAAARWEATQRRISERRLAEANRALQEFDLELARGLARRIERRFLADGEAFDRLILDIESRAMEFQSLREAQRRFSEDTGWPNDRRPWWRRHKQ